MSRAQMRHICEVCGVEEILTPEDAYAAGWDYPPKVAEFGIVSPRTCPNCPIDQTVWWAIVVDNCTGDMLTPAQRETVARIANEPDSIAVPQ